MNILKPDYHIADLTEEQKEKLDQYQQEFGKVLIAWEPDSNEQNSHKQ
ncbi:hypothetical protein [Bacillus marinisedimentorum]|nr:hypothetical protein [Bacillus marinisedimentorum]